jgi:hypothetical protein
MAEIGRFFDGPAYGAQAHAEFYTNFLSTGFFWGLDVTANNTLEVTVASGAAFLEGHEYRNTESLNLEHNIADSANDRIDRVVIRLDNTPEAERPLRAMVRTGMPSSNPEPPELVRNDAVYEISLARVLVEAGKSFIEQYQIIDERGIKDLCGRVDLPSRFTEQIDSIDIRTPDVPAGEYAEGFSRFRISGDSSAEIFQEWLDSIGVSPEDYGRNLSQLRAYVETTGNRTNTGVQTITIHDWSIASNYQIYGKFTRASNAATTGSSWGRWQETVLVVDEGENQNGNYIRYSDGTMECWGDPFTLSANISTGALYRSETEWWTFPSSFAISPVVTGNIASVNRWVGTTGLENDQVPIRVYGTTSADSEFRVRLRAWGRWRP